MSSSCWWQKDKTFMPKWKIGWIWFQQAAIFFKINLVCFILLWQLFNVWLYCVLVWINDGKQCKFFSVSPSAAYANLAIPLFSPLNKIEVHQSRASCFFLYLFVNVTCFGRAKLIDPGHIDLTSDIHCSKKYLNYSLI